MVAFNTRACDINCRMMLNYGGWVGGKITAPTARLLQNRPNPTNQQRKQSQLATETTDPIVSHLLLFELLLSKLPAGGSLDTNDVGHAFRW